MVYRMIVISCSSSPANRTAVILAWLHIIIRFSFSIKALVAVLVS